MILDIVICIMVVILILRGAFLFVKMLAMWKMFGMIDRIYNKKTVGKVVDLELKSYSNDNIAEYCPTVVCKLVGEKVQAVRFTASLESVEGQTSYIFYPKDYYIGEKVTVMYSSDNRNLIFVVPRMHLLRLFCVLFIPGCLYFLSAYLGISFVFS